MLVCIDDWLALMLVCIDDLAQAIFFLLKAHTLCLKTSRSQKARASKLLFLGAFCFRNPLQYPYAGKS